MKLFLKMLFGGIFLWMTVLTVRTSLTVSLWDAWSSLWSRTIWFLLIIGLGNIAISFYMLIQLTRLHRDEPVEAILWRRAQ